MDKSTHHPPHIKQDETWYFITAHTFGKEKCFSNFEYKGYWCNALVKNVVKFNLRIKAYVILDDHYHLLCYFPEGNSLPTFIKYLHGTTSYYINKLEGIKGRKIWYSYWDRLIRDESDFWIKYNYIHYNPVKHGYVNQPEDWYFSSYCFYLLTKGREWIDDCWQSYPILEYDFEK